jgi:dihydroorotase
VSDLKATGLFALVGARVIDPASGVDGERTVLVRDGRIAGVELPGALPSGVQVIDVRGVWLTPGFIDLHVHFREPGEEHKETIATGALSAVAGGFTTVVAMPNTKPVIDNAALVRFVLRKSEEAGLARVLPSAAITIGQKGEQITEFGDLFEAGAVCLTDDGRPVASAGVMRRALEYSTLFDLPVMVHEEEPSLSGGCMHEGDVSIRLGLKGIPSAAEDVMVHRDIVLAEMTGARLHIAHISTLGSVRAVREARARGIKVTAEATPHHFTLTDKAVENYETNAKMAPPLRAELDRLAVVEGLKDGTIDAIATDHAPHAVVDKESEFDRAANGIIGLETALGLTLRLVDRGELSALRAIELLTSGPARAFSLQAGSLKAGAAADITIFAPDQRWTVRADRIRSRSRNTPFLGWELQGRVLRTFVGGREVYAAE